jgi:hypothetical protein
MVGRPAAAAAGGGGLILGDRQAHPKGHAGISIYTGSSARSKFFHQRSNFLAPAKVKNRITTTEGLVLYNVYKSNPAKNVRGVSAFSNPVGIFRWT